MNHKVKPSRHRADQWGRLKEQLRQERAKTKLLQAYIYEHIQVKEFASWLISPNKPLISDEVVESAFKFYTRQEKVSGKLWK